MSALSPQPFDADALNQRAVQEIQAALSPGQRVVFVSGNFNVVHPGHLRLLQFAKECGDVLVVGVLGDQLTSAFVDQNLRLEGVRSISWVDYAFILRVTPEQFIGALRPTVVVKGKEHEDRHNSERSVVESYGGKLLFGSGEVRFSSIDLLQRELRETNFSTIQKPSDFPKRHGFQIADLREVVGSFRNLKVVVVGDLIVDEYISCDPLGMSQEDPTIVVTPIKTDRFVGGAGIVAAHARGLGASVSFFGVSGKDAVARFAAETLYKYGVEGELIADDSRPTTLKQRYRAGGKTLLRVSHLRQHDISEEIEDVLLTKIIAATDTADLVIFSDFSYGCLPQSLVDRISERIRSRNLFMVADSQASSQVGDVSRFKQMNLLTPTEHEARLAVRDFTSGLVVLAQSLMQKAEAQSVFVTLGSEGMLIHAPHDAENGLETDRLPSFNTAPKDVSGAGDSLLTCAAMARAVGASVWQAAYLGSIAAACQVGRVGNRPLTSAELITELEF